MLSVVILLLGIITNVRGQLSNEGCGPINTNLGCGIIVAGIFTPGSTVYYDPTDSSPFQFLASDIGTCDVGSFSSVSIYTLVGGQQKTLVANCGCLSLSSVTQTITCNGITLGSLPEGTYVLVFVTESNDEASAIFTVTHEQQTVMAATPTTTVTSTSTSTTTTTITTTNTDTETSSQVVVTSPAVTTSTTITVTPAKVKTTTTKTQTFTAVKEIFSFVTTTETRSAPCHRPTPVICPKGNPSKKRSVMRIEERDDIGLKKRVPVNLEKRDVVGDGPLTVTVTPAASVVTSTATTTSTESDTTAVDTTTTVPPTPLTSTVYTGITTDMATVTLPTVTKTKTRYTATHTTITKTLTFTLVAGVVVTPICKVD